MVEANSRTYSTWYQSGNFVFSSANLNDAKIAYYRYVWNRSPSTTVISSDTQWISGSGNLSLSGQNSKTGYLHVLAYNADGIPAMQGTQHYGPYYYVGVDRLLRHGKFFDDDGNLIEMGPKQ